MIYLYDDLTTLTTDSNHRISRKIGERTSDPSITANHMNMNRSYSVPHRSAGEHNFDQFDEFSNSASNLNRNDNVSSALRESDVIMGDFSPASVHSGHAVNSPNTDSHIHKRASTVRVNPREVNKLYENILSQVSFEQTKNGLPENISSDENQTPDILDAIDNIGKKQEIQEKKYQDMIHNKQTSYNSNHSTTTTATKTTTAPAAPAAPIPGMNNIDISALLLPPASMIGKKTKKNKVKSYLSDLKTQEDSDDDGNVSSEMMRPSSIFTDDDTPRSSAGPPIPHPNSILPPNMYGNNNSNSGYPNTYDNYANYPNESLNNISNNLFNYNTLNASNNKATISNYNSGQEPEVPLPSDNVTDDILPEDGENIDLDDIFITDHHIGRGRTAMVQQALYKSTVLVAVKEFAFKQLSGKILKDFHVEVNTLKKLRHPNIAMFIRSHLDKTTNELYLMY